MHSGISRRGLLRGLAVAAGIAGVGLTTGCDLFSRGSAEQQSEATPELTALLAGTVALADAYDATIARVPALTAALTGLRDAHRAHARELAQALDLPAPSATATASGSSPSDQAAARAALLEAETKGQAAARQACLGSSNRLAPLLGTMAAARACHQEVLR